MQGWFSTAGIWLKNMIEYRPKLIAGSYELIIDDGNVTDQEIREVIRRVEEQQKIYERDEESAVQER